MKKMKTTLIIIGGIAFLACAYYYHKRKSPVTMTPEQALDDFLDNLLNTSATEQVEQLSMEDVVAYFKGLQLQQGTDIPIVAQTSRDSRKIYILGTFNEKTHEFEKYKLVAPNVVTEDLITAIGEEKMIVLN